MAASQRRVCGRPRRVTDAVIARVLQWHDERVTAAQLAAELGISPSTVRSIIRSRGAHYKSPSPEHRPAPLPRRGRERSCVCL
jgi:hypothetical protein